MKTILLVDSLKDSLEIKKSLLTRANFRLLTATSGFEALRIHHKEKVNLIIAELDMPGMGGDALCTTVRSNNEIRTVSVILLCEGRAADLERVSKCGANAWVAKPVKPEELLEKVGQLVAISSRKGYRVLLRAKVVSAKDSGPFFCTSCNVSATGMLVETETILKKGDVIFCSFFLPGSRRIETDAEVVRTTETKDSLHNYGLRFIHLPPEARDDIESFIAGTVRTD